MDRKLDREFVHIFHESEGNQLSAEVKDALTRLGGFRHCMVNNHKETTTISCQGLGGLGHLIDTCTRVDDEGPDLRFFGAIKEALAKYIS